MGLIDKEQVRSENELLPGSPMFNKKMNQSNVITSIYYKNRHWFKFISKMNQTSVMISIVLKVHFYLSPTERERRLNLLSFCRRERDPRRAKPERQTRITQEIKKMKAQAQAQIQTTGFDVQQISEHLAIATPRNPNYKARMNVTNENISWAMYSWNPVTGCYFLCEYCYAKAKAENPFFASGFPTQFKPTLYPARLSAPSRTRIPAAQKDNPGARRVFVCSMADLFGDWVPVEWIEQIIETCVAAPDFDFLFLTKNPARYLDFEFPKNCWLGATADRQRRAKAAVDVFRQISGNVKFLSCEPLMEQVTFPNNGLSAPDLVIIGALKGSENTHRQPNREWVAL
jgi:protein gp37